MELNIILATGFVALVLAVALVREVRLRRALQMLLARIFTLWRNQRHADEHSSSWERENHHEPDRGDAADARRDRLR